MGTTLEILVEQIRTHTEKLNRTDTDQVATVLEVAKLFVVLRSKFMYSTWLPSVEEMGYDKRMAQRYVAIGKAEWCDIVAQDTELRARIPYNLEKLEKLRKLSTEQVRRLSGDIDLRRTPPNELAAKVKQLLGVVTAPSKRKEADQTAGDAIINAVNPLVTRMRKLIGERTEELADVAVREHVMNAVWNAFDKLWVSVGWTTEEAVEDPEAEANETSEEELSDTSEEDLPSEFVNEDDDEIDEAEELEEEEATEAGQPEVSSGTGAAEPLFGSGRTSNPWANRGAPPKGRKRELLIRNVEIVSEK